MVPTAVSQIVEQVVNAAVSIGAAWLLFHYGLKIDHLLGTETAAYAYGAAGSTLGTGAGAFVGLIFLIFILLVYQRVMSRRVASDRHGETESVWEIYGLPDRNDPSGYFKYRCLQYQRHH